MLQQFTHTDEEWSPPNFVHDGVHIIVEVIAGHCHAEATTVFATSRRSRMLHADKHCHRLHQSEPKEFAEANPHDGEFRVITAFPLEAVLSEWEWETCSFCTQDEERTVEIATEIDGVPENIIRERSVEA